MNKFCLPAISHAIRLHNCLSKLLINAGADKTICFFAGMKVLDYTK